MAKRLTKFNKTGWVLKLDEPQNEFEARQQLMSKFKLACEKLGKIEDILEKYGIESVEELEKKLADSDTWKRACELACEREDDCYVYDNIHRAYEFYQQAKKEGNDESNND